MKKQGSFEKLDLVNDIAGCTEMCAGSCHLSKAVLVQVKDCRAHFIQLMQKSPSFITAHSDVGLYLSFPPLPSAHALPYQSLEVPLPNQSYLNCTYMSYEYVSLYNLSNLSDRTKYQSPSTCHCCYLSSLSSCRSLRNQYI